MLTAKQKQLLVFIQDRIRETGVSPSFDEMRDALDLASKSGIHRLITALEERGFLRRLPHRARALEVVKLPEDAANADDLNPPAPINPAAETAEVPLMGRIAAGTPIDAIQHEVDRLAVPKQMVGAGEHYALLVHGDSMVEAGIHDGDTAVIRRAETALDGDIVVALVDREEATLKTLRRRKGIIALEPANTEFEIQEFAPNRVAIQGKLVGLIRRYT